ASSGQRSTVSNRNLRLARRRVSQGWLRRQISRSVLQLPKRWTSQRTVLMQQLPWPRMERAPSPSPPMEKVQKNPPRQLRSRRVWSRKWLRRYSRKRSFFPPTSPSLKTALVPDRYNRLDGRASHHGIDLQPAAH